MSGARIDHLVVLASSLGSGSAWLADMLGVAPVVGGEHEAWGTHNRLLKLDEQTYLEVLAVNPDVPQPGPFYPMGLGDPDVQRRLRLSPFLAHWFVRISGMTWDGVAEYSRGENRWRSVRAVDGSLPLSGVAPTKIEWLTPQPATMLPDSGVSLLNLELQHPDLDALRSYLPPCLADERVTVVEGEACLSAIFATPRGEVAL